MDYKSIEEFEERFFPESLKKQLEASTDAKTLGILLARNALKKIKNYLKKK